MIDFSKYNNKTLRLTKMKDNVFNNEHPNNINEGAIREGEVNIKMCTEHQCFFLHPNPDRFFHTSEVKKIETMEGYDLAHTVNSIYKVEIID
jgi:hypothetical protein